MHVFVSYAREDKRWFDPDYHFNLVPYLTESLRRNGVTFWYDKSLLGGDEFRRRIEAEIDRAQIALLIVSQHFLNSEFIESFEMPRIAQRAQRGQMLVVPVLVEPCDWIDYSFLADRQMVPSSSPLIHFTESEAKWADVRFQILDGLKTQVKRIREAMNAEALRRETEELKKREKELAVQSKGDDAARIAQEAADRKAREESEQRAREAAEQKARESAANQAALEEIVRKRAEERQLREREQEALRQKEAAERKAREKKERKSRDGEKGSTTALLEVLLRQKRFLLACVVACIGIGALVAYRHWSIYAGAKWVPLKSDVTVSLYSIAASSDGKILYTCGYGTPFLDSTNGGTTWANQGTGVRSSCKSIFTTSDGSRVWASGSDSKVVESTDRGTNWAIVRAKTKSTATGQSSSGSSTPFESFYDLFGLNGSSTIDAIFGTPDGTHLWASGTNGDIEQSDNGSANWTIRFTPTNSELLAISGTPDGNILVAVGAKGTVIATVNSGTDWKSETSGTGSDLRAVFVAADSKLVCAVGDMGVIRISTDKGATWSAGQSGVGASLHGVFGTSDGKHLWAVGTSGIIIQSDDRGATWKLRTSDTKSGLNAILGTSDGKLLYAVGDNGTILESKSGFY